MADTVVIRNGMSDIFQQSQRTIAAHQNLMRKLKRGLHEPAIEQNGAKQFTDLFFQFVLRTLAIPKGETSADRVIAFIASYMGYLLSNASETDENAVNEELEGYFSFLDFILRGIRPGMRAKDRNVRYRTCQLTLAILQEVSELSDEECEAILNEALARTYDKDHNVRAQAVLILATLTDSTEAEPSEYTLSLRTRLEDLAQLDPSPDVRRAALFNIPHDRTKFPLLVERARDVNNVNRRAIYTRIIPSLGDFRQLKIEDREKLLDWGLKDRDATVKDAATKMLVSSWLKTVDNDLIALLCRLDVVNSNIAETALEAFFGVRRDVIESKMVFSNEFWQDLTLEGAFLVRWFHSYCVKNKLDNIIEERLPTLSGVAAFIAEYWNDCQEQESESQEYIELEFIVEQLLMMAKAYDLGDETGRRTLVSTLRAIATSSRSPSETIVREIMRIHRKLAVSDSDFLLGALELIEDVRDVLSPEESSQQDDSSDLAFIMVCLSITEETLRLIEKEIDDKTRLKTLYEGYVRPALQSNEPSIGTRGMRCLGLLSLANREMCAVGFDLLIDSYRAIQEDPDEVQFEERRVIVQALADITLTYGVISGPTLSILREMLDEEDDIEMATIAAQALARILLVGLCTDAKIVKSLLVTYYTITGPARDQLQQALTFFWPVYCESHLEHQQLVASVVLSAFHEISDSYDTDEKTSGGLTLTQIMTQLVDWTDPSKIRTGHSESHIILAHDLVTGLKHSSVRSIQRTITGALLKLNLEGIGTESHTKLVQLIDSVDLNLDGNSSKALLKFQQTVAEIKLDATDNILDALDEPEQVPEDEPVAEPMEVNAEPQPEHQPEFVPVAPQTPLHQTAQPETPFHVNASTAASANRSYHTPFKQPAVPQTPVRQTSVPLEDSDEEMDVSEDDIQA